MASVHINANCNEVVAHLPGVIGAVAAKAQEGAGRAEAILARHQPGKQPGSGGSHITVTHGSVDSFVNLIDPGGAAVNIEFGRSGGRGGAMQGIRAISGAF